MSEMLNNPDKAKKINAILKLRDEMDAERFYERCFVTSVTSVTSAPK